MVLSLNIMGKPVSSCNNCRHSRVGCNAMSTPGQRCFNCVRKGLKCSFRPGATSGKDEKKAQAPREGRVSQNGGQLPTPEPSAPFGNIRDSCGMIFEPSAELGPSLSSSLPLPSLSTFSDSLAKSQQALRLHHLLWNVFTTNLEPRIGLWIGGASCPFMTTSTAQPTLISSLMIDLDKSPASPRRNTVQEHKTLNGIESESGDDGSINRALIFAIYAYSVRWLQPTDNKQNQDPEIRSRFIALKKELSDNLWSETRKRMYAVMSRPSYRSILALYLFAIIPSSSRKGGDNMEDLCLEASLNQQNYLSSKVQMPSTHHESIASLLGGGAFSSMKIALAQANPPPNAEKIEYQSMASLAFWFGIISDTTRALTHCRPSILLPGCNGEAKVWAAVRERTQAFEKQFSSLRQLRTPFLDDQVIAILQHAFAFSTLVWAAIARVQDALVYQISGTSAAEAVDAVRKESNKFEETFGKLLCLCQRDFMLLNRTTQMCYTSLNIRFQVAGLILADALPSAFVFIDQNLSPYDLRLCACRSIINTLNLALQTKSFGTNDSPALSVLLLDPYPDLMTNHIICTGSSLFLLYTMQKLTQGNVTAMFAVVIDALEVLAEISHTASEAIPLLKQKFAVSGIDHTAAFQNDALHHAAVSMSTPEEQGLFDAEAVRQLEWQATDAFLVEQFLEGSENSLRSDQSPNELDPCALDPLSQDWVFGDCITTF